MSDDAHDAVVLAFAMYLIYHLALVAFGGGIT